LEGKEIKMPNWAHNWISFNTSTKEEAKSIYDSICINGEVSFETLIPKPKTIKIREVPLDLKSADMNEWEWLNWHTNGVFVS
jgi:hypothetical protein